MSRATYLDARRVRHARIQLGDEPRKLVRIRLADARRFEEKVGPDIVLRDAPPVEDGKATEARQHEVLEDLPRKARGADDEHACMLERRLPRLVPQPQLAVVPLRLPVGPPCRHACPCGVLTQPFFGFFQHGGALVGGRAACGACQ